MNIKKYDNKLVRITDIFNEEYEGICSYNNKDYNYHEYAKNEESLVIEYIMFFKSLIKKVEEINDFSDKYGHLEEIVVEDGNDIIEEVFDSEEDIHILRLLHYIKDNTSKINDKDGLIKLLENLVKYNENENIINEANIIKNVLVNK